MFEAVLGLVVVEVWYVRKRGPPDVYPTICCPERRRTGPVEGPAEPVAGPSRTRLTMVRGQVPLTRAVRGAILRDHLVRAPERWEGKWA